MPRQRGGKGKGGGAIRRSQKKNSNAMPLKEGFSGEQKVKAKKGKEKEGVGKPSLRGRGGRKNPPAFPAPWKG